MVVSDLVIFLKVIERCVRKQMKNCKNTCKFQISICARAHLQIFVFSFHVPNINSTKCQQTVFTIWIKLITYSLGFNVTGSKLHQWRTCWFDQREKSLRFLIVDNQNIPFSRIGNRAVGSVSMWCLARKKSMPDIVRSRNQMWQIFMVDVKPSPTKKYKCK